MKTHMKINFDALTAYWSIGLGWMASFMSPIAPFIVLMVFLIFGDLYSGVKAARKRGEQIRSRGIQRTVEKILLYFFVILSAHGMQVVFYLEYFPIVYVAAFAICLTEFKSIVENVQSVTGTNILDKLKDFFSKNSKE